MKEKKSSDWIDGLKEGEADTLDFYIQTNYSVRIVNNLGLNIKNNIEKVINLLWLKYSVKWDRLWTSYTVEYNPIWNIDGTVTETEERDLTSGHTGTDTTGTTGTDTLKHTGTDTTGTTGTDKEERSGSDQRQTTGNVYGFDSSGAVPAESGSETVTAGIGTTNTKSENTTNTKNLTDATTYGRKDTIEHNTQDTDKGTITKTTKRGGNIGVTMTQQMLEADAEYWNKCTSLFFETVCKDIVDTITYKIYTEDRETSVDGTTTTGERKYNLNIVSKYTSETGIEIADIELEEI